ncbi:protein BIC1 [Lactuca sativa]|uniref:Protein BIC1 n=1 Tax=Lactuca sativa TaxID=4236 RepID=A0A9R1WM63_LACSA|nr:protein BIC1 [Lactuca sativa]KAJ0185140.1 hypothetical protein LSAT_V11C900463530 [Lactuca sativa]
MDSHKNPNLETTHSIPSSSQDLKINHGFNNLENKSSSFSLVVNGEHDVNDGRSTISTPSPSPPAAAAAEEEECGRERLKRHRVEMAGRVWIPDIWGQEDLLNDWIDCSVFDSSLGNSSILSARTALVQEARSTLRIENRC